MRKIICDLCGGDINVKTIPFKKIIQFDDSKSIYKSVEVSLDANITIDLCNKCIEKMQKGIKEATKTVIGEVVKEEII